MGRKSTDLTGMKFGKLTVTRRYEDDTPKNVRWYCDCECGTKDKIVSARNLKSGHTTTCGCSKTRKGSDNPQMIDLTGRKFTRLTVLSYYPDSPSRKPQWLCRCDCGNEVIVDGGNLKSGMTKSCGCYMRDRVSEANKKYNTYEFQGDLGTGYTTSGVAFTFDAEDYDLIKDICWFQTRDKAIAGRRGNDVVFLHRFVMGVDDGAPVHVEHINHVGTDNRKSNLKTVQYVRKNTEE